MYEDISDHPKGTVFCRFSFLGNGEKNNFEKSLSLVKMPLYQKNTDSIVDLLKNVDINLADLIYKVGTEVSLNTGALNKYVYN